LGEVPLRFLIVFAGEEGQPNLIRPENTNIGHDTLIQNQFFLNTHEDWEEVLKNRCLRNLDRRRILDRVRMDANHISLSRPEF